MIKWFWLALAATFLAAAAYMFRMENLGDGILYRNRWTGRIYNGHPNGFELLDDREKCDVVTTPAKMVKYRMDDGTKINVDKSEIEQFLKEIQSVGRTAERVSP